MSWKNEKTTENAPDKTVRSSYMRTDLASECYPPAAAEASREKLEHTDADGLTCDIYTRGKTAVTRLCVIDDAGAKKIGKPCGTYVTLDAGKVWQMSAQERDLVAEAIAEELSDIIAGCCEKYGIPTEEREGDAHPSGCVLIAGLGNRNITTDALGPMCADSVTVTRHIRLSDGALFGKLDCDELAAIAPGVVGQTGIETAELIRSAAAVTKPSLIIAIDALAARSTDRLATTVQICDTGISPGSGIGNLRSAVNRESMGVPVIAVGVPTIVDSSTLVCDALERAGIEDIPPALRDVLESGRSFFVSLKESDEAMEAISGVISQAIGICLGTNFA